MTVSMRVMLAGQRDTTVRSRAWSEDRTMGGATAVTRYYAVRARHPAAGSAGRGFMHSATVR